MVRYPGLGSFPDLVPERFFPEKARLAGLKGPPFLLERPLAAIKSMWQQGRKTLQFAVIGVTTRALPACSN